MYFTFNDITSSSHGLIVTGVSNPNPAIIRLTKQVGNRQYVGRTQFAPREITVGITYLAASTAEMYQKITDVTNWLSTAAAKKLILSDDSTKYYKAVADFNIEKQINNRLFEATITFACLDNCIYSVSDDSVVWSPDTYL